MTVRTAHFHSPSLASFIPWLVLLASCSSPPKPPTVDESKKRPANAAMAVDLQVCKNELLNTRLLATETSRQLETTTATLANIAARQQWLASLQAPGNDQALAQANSLFNVRFEYGSTRVFIPPALASALVNEAKAAPLVLLRGRTDGTQDAVAESRIARERAVAVRDHLVASGVDPARIRITYQPSGDHVANNAVAEGRSLNRRVEIELYRALPVTPAVAAMAAVTEKAQP